MSYHAGEGRFLVALLLCGICSIATTYAADAHSQQAVTIDTSHLRSRYRLLSVVNRSDWTADLSGIEDVIYETLIRRDPASIGAADVRIEGTGDSRTRNLVVRLFKKNTNDFSTHVITIDKADLRRKPLEAVRELYSRCDDTCLKKLIDQAVCPDAGNPNPTSALFATPGLGPDGQQDPLAKDTVSQAMKIAADRHINVLQLLGSDATPQSYFNWLVCPSVRLFGSIAKKDSTTGDIALFGGELPANWFTAFKNSPLTGKIIFFNSGPAYNTGMLASARDDAKVRTFIAVNENRKLFNEEKAANVFTCFWEKSLTPKQAGSGPLRLKVWGSMGFLLRTCENDKWGEPDVFSIVGDQGPIWKLGGLDPSVFELPPLNEPL